MIVVTAEEMREMDRLTIEEHGVPSLLLMERAGQGVTKALLSRFGRIARGGVVVVAGKGNNGGDGFVVARLLKKKGIRGEVVLLARREELSRDAAENMRAYLKMKGRLFEATENLRQSLGERLRGKRLVVDAILGTGLKEEVRGLYGEAIDTINASGLPVVAVDVPSGLDTERGRPLGTTIKAEMTVALGYAKVGEVIYPGLSYVGELLVADIGIHPDAVKQVRPGVELMEGSDIAGLIPRRKPDTHKGTYGHLLVVAGSRGKTGAAILACRAAMRVGTGLVTLAAPRSLNDIFASSLVEVMTEPLSNDPQEEIEPLSEEEWRGLLERKSALLFGPGIGVKESARSALRWLLKNLDVPWVIDADGLNNLVGELDTLRGAKNPPVLTPHPGEMARLMKLDTASVNQDRIGVARTFARNHRCHVVLKGARTVIATLDGDVFINPTGNPGMASGGMGDVLAGMLAGLLAQGFRVEDALRLGVFLHGFVGDQVREERGAMGMIASDLLEALPQGIQRLAESSSFILYPSSSVVLSRSEAQTRSWGKKLGRVLQGGEIIGLTGELGTGKTCFVRGMAEGLEVGKEAWVRSPSFTLINEYHGRLALFHIDLYRVAGQAEIEELNLRDYLFSDGVSVIEWFDHLPTEEAEEYMRVDFAYANGKERRLTFSAHGERYEKVLQALGGRRKAVGSRQ